MDDRANPYRSLESGGADEIARREPRQTWTPSVRSLVLALAMAAVTAAIVGVLMAANVESVGPYLLVVLIGSIASVRFAVRGVAQTFRDFAGPARRPLTTLAVLGGFSVLLANLAMAVGGSYVVLLSLLGSARGRELRRHARVLLPPVASGTDWAEPADPGRLAASESVPDGVAAEWRENGRTEHASVAAFARLTLDLMAVGAPPGLVAASHLDGLDEVRHTELCFALARQLDGRAAGPASFPEARNVPRPPRTRALALAKLAVDSLVDGALNEGVSARSLARLAERCDAEPIRAVLKQLAADEGRHAAHGWDVVEWCLAEGGWVAEKALTGALRALPAGQRSKRPEAATSGAWERWGIPGRALEEAEYRAAHAHLVARLGALLPSASSAAA